MSHSDLDLLRTQVRHLDTTPRGAFGSGHTVRDSEAFMNAIDATPEEFAAAVARQVAGRPPHSPLVPPSRKHTQSSKDPAK